nr:IucA/IucC family C-terminal-domain containing protein [Neobacillus sp. Marseille-Q6967]
MVNALKENDVMMLEKYRLRTKIGQSFQVADLLDKSYLSCFMGNLSQTIGAPTEKIAASIFMKRYAFIAVVSLYVMTVYNKKLYVDLSNILMEEPQHGKDWLPLISLKDQVAADWDGVDRDQWRKKVYQDLFAKNINPLIIQLEKTFKISKLILWENIAVYLFWLYETELTNHEDSNVKADFEFLLKGAEGPLFGSYHHNPVAKYFGEKKWLDDIKDEVRIRKTCCFTYQLASKPKRCKTCPCTHVSKDGGCQDGESICSAVQCFD